MDNSHTYLLQRSHVRFVVSVLVYSLSLSVAGEPLTTPSVEAQQSSLAAISEVQNSVYNPKDQPVAALQKRLSPYLSPSEHISYYQAIKASAWLNYAAHEGSEKSSSVARREALQQAQGIIELLEKDQAQDLRLTTPILSVSSVMRRDLWANAELLKQHPGFSCAQSDVAQAEVMLVWAAAEHCELGWRHSRELFLSAQRLIDQANQKAVACRPDAPQQFAKISYPSLEELNGSEKGCHGVKGTWPIWSPQQAAIVEKEEIVPESSVPNVVHFALDQVGLSTQSISVLKQIAEFLKQHPNYTLTLYGYTDTRASVQYNLKLSKRRAQSVLDYLQQQQIDLSRIAVEAKGKTQAIDDQDQKVGHALSRRVELVYVDPEGKEIKTIRQQQDLQLEK